jgi:2-polyprenyl-3-methyl-5-hydroxy-6-metoxy-1,4-benzoquinol methylase
VLITEKYRALNINLHQDPRYGSRVRHKLYVAIGELAMKVGAKTILDYGCGKGEMSKHLSKVTNYDPAVYEYFGKPRPHDVVACCDVLEHVEPECLEEVLQDIERVAKKAIYLVISTRLASKILSDGRNAHLIVESPSWWLEKIKTSFTGWQVKTVDTSKPSEVTFILLGV